MKVIDAVCLCQATGQLVEPSQALDDTIWRVRLGFSSHELRVWYLAAQTSAGQDKLQAFQGAVPELYTCHRAIFSFHVPFSLEVDSETLASEFILKKAEKAFTEIF